MRNNTLFWSSFVTVDWRRNCAIYCVAHRPPKYCGKSRAGAGDAPRDLKDVKLGLDLRGGTQVLLEADLVEGQSVEAGSMDTAKTIVENRVNGLGVAEAIVQLQGEERIIVELPGVKQSRSGRRDDSIHRPVGVC
jgi:preprotein translocase subunit SecD